MNFLYYSIPWSLFNLPLAGWDYVIDHTVQEQIQEQSKMT